MAAIGNMGPFSPVRFKGGSKADAVPVFIDKLPMTLGGIAGVDAIFGRVVSRQGASHQFLKGIPAGSFPVGILIYDPIIAAVDPAMNNKYYEGRPATVVTYGLIELASYDLTLQAPNFGSLVVANNTDGRLGFINSGGSVPAGWTQIQATVYDINEPNGTKIFVNYPIATPTATAFVQAATPVASPAAGAVARGTKLMITSATVGAEVKYTLDGTTPTMESPTFPPEGLGLEYPVTVKAIAVAQGYSPSAALTAAYTIS